MVLVLTLMVLVLVLVLTLPVLTTSLVVGLSDRSMTMLSLMSMLPCVTSRHSFIDHFPRQPRYTSIRMFPFGILLGLKGLKVGSGDDNWSYYACVKLQLNYHHQQTNTQLFQARCPSCRPTNSVRSLKRSDLHQNIKAVNAESSACVS